MLLPAVVLACCTTVIIGVGIHGRAEGRVKFRIRGHQSTLVILGYGPHG